MSLGAALRSLWELRASGRAGVVVLFGGRLGANLLQIAFVIGTARSLGPTGRGVVVLGTTVVTASTLVVAGGIAVVVRSKVAAREPGALAAVAGLSLPVGAVNCLVGVSAAWVVLSASDAHQGISELALLAAIAAVGGPLWIYLEATIGSGRHRYAAMAEVTSAGLQIGLYLLLVTFSPPSVALVLVAILLAHSIELGVLVVRTDERRWRPDFPVWSSLLRKSSHSSAQASIEFFLFRADRLLLGMVGTPADVGLYSVAATAAEMLRLLPHAVGQVLAQAVARGDGTTATIRRARWGTAIVMSLMAVGAWLLGPVLIVPLLGPGFARSATFVGILCLAELPLALYYLEVSVLQGAGRYRDAANAARWGFGPSLVLTIGLVIMFGIWGAVFATLLSFSTLASLAAWSGSRRSSTVR